MSQAGRYIAGGVGPGGPVNTLTADAGGAVPPTAGNINILGGANIDTTGNPGTSTITVALENNVNIPGTLGVGGAVTLTNLAGFGPGIVRASNTGLLDKTFGSDGQVIIGATGANPTFATISAGSGITITLAPNAINIAATGGGITWTQVVVPTVMAVNNGYITNSGVMLAMTLPAVAAVGNVVKIAGKGVGGWTIVQNAGQQIHFLAQATTIGVLGSLSSNTPFDCIELLCITANTDWVVLNVVGNITVV